MKVDLDLKLDNWVLSRLSEPFLPGEIRWRAQGGNLAVPYLDARLVANRLNEVVGASNWRDSYTEVEMMTTEVRDVTNYEALVEKKLATVDRYNRHRADDRFKTFEYNNITYGGIRCDLTVLGSTKSDVGSPSNVDQIKGGYSDSLKRAAVKFGIGEYLYQVPPQEAEIYRGRVVTPPELPDFAIPRQAGSPDELLKGQIDAVRESLEGPDLEYAEALIAYITVMGVYSSRTPLVVKRAVYEGLQVLLS